jgi:uncharacterized membrane protein YfcA
MDVALLPWLLAAGFFAIAVLYSSVGHAGASGYIAVMTLVGMAVPEIRPTALALNLVVGAIGIVRFGRAGLVAWRALPPLVLASAPMAWVGARLQLPHGAHELALAAVLLFTSVVLWRTADRAADETAVSPTRVPWLPGLTAGASIGLVSGVTGTGGAIFLTPLLLFANWAPTRQASGLSVAFVWINSLLGLAGLWSTGLALPTAFPWWAAAVALGAVVGTQLGLKMLPVPTLRRALALVLLIAVAKLVQNALS